MTIALDKIAHGAVSMAMTLAGALLTRHWLIVSGLVLMLGGLREVAQALTARWPRAAAWATRSPLIAACVIGDAERGDLLANMIGVALALLVCGVAGVAA